MAFFAVTASAQVYVRPHVTKDGTYVQGYERTAPNNTNTDNYSTRGNTNPYTGQAGTVEPNYGQSAPSQNNSYYGQQQQCGTNKNGQYVCR